NECLNYTAARETHRRPRGPSMTMSRLIACIVACAALWGCAVNLGPNVPPRSDDLFARVQRGMTQQEVQGLLGRPDNTMDFSRNSTTSWGYYYWDTWGYYS